MMYLLKLKHKQVFYEQSYYVNSVPHFHDLSFCFCFS